MWIYYVCAIAGICFCMKDAKSKCTQQLVQVMRGVVAFYTAELVVPAGHEGPMDEACCPIRRGGPVAMESLTFNPVSVHHKVHLMCAYLETFM